MNPIHPFDLTVFSNIPLWAAFFSWCSAQAIKLAIDFAKTRRVDFRTDEDPIGPVRAFFRRRAAAHRR